MARNCGRWLGWFVILVVVTGCAAPAAPASPSSSAIGQLATTAPVNTGPKRVTAGIVAEPLLLSETARQGGPSTVGIQLEELLNAGLTERDESGQLHAQLAEAVPTLDNGLWKIQPDGRMETTWKLKPNLKWHDGAPFSTDDLLFTAMVERDPEVPRASRNPSYEMIDRIEIPAPGTLTIFWKGPFINADRMFTHAFTFILPMPEHILGPAYREDKTNFMKQSYWLSDFVGTGPFRLKEFVSGSHMVFAANPDYVLGRPKIDEMEIRFIPDSNALVANLLAGTVELTFPGGFSVDQAAELRDQWRDGVVLTGPGSWIVTSPQLLNSSPAVVSNLQFRRALYQAIDRKQLVDTLMRGFGGVAHSYLEPDQPQYAEIERSLPHYDYGPQRAMQMIQELGYTRGADGYFQDAQGQRLSLELRATAQPQLGVNAVLSIADYWQKVGVGVDQVIVPPQRAQDAEYQATFPGFYLQNGGPHDVEGLPQLQSNKARVPENRFVGSNHSRYMNPEFDALIDRFYVTVPIPQRMDLLGQILPHISENLNIMPVVYGPNFIMVGKRINGVVAAKSPSSNAILWNAHQWGVQ